MSERKLRRPIPNDKPRELSAKDISSTEQTAVIPGRSLERRTPTAGRLGRKGKRHSDINGGAQ